MLIRDLPEEAKRELRALLEADGERWELIEGLTPEEFDLWFKAREEDDAARLERINRRLAVETELRELERPVLNQYPDLPWRKVEYFLHGEARARFQQLRRELREMSDGPLVTRNRQPWHEAVEQEIEIHLRKGGFSIHPHKGWFTIDQVVAAVLARDSVYPPEPVRQYSTYILETWAGLR